MQKFSELVYTRPDIAAIADSIRAYTAALANAKSFEETRDLFLSHTAKMSEFFTMNTIASVRNSVDTRDAFYEAEIEYLDSEAPKLDLIMRESGEALLASPFRAEMEQEFGTLYFKNLDIQKQFADERIVDDRVQESKLCEGTGKEAKMVILERAAQSFVPSLPSTLRLRCFLQTPPSWNKEAFHLQPTLRPY